MRVCVCVCVCVYACMYFVRFIQFAKMRTFFEIHFCLSLNWLLSFSTGFWWMIAVGSMRNQRRALNAYPGCWLVQIVFWSTIRFQASYPAWLHSHYKSTSWLNSKFSMPINLPLTRLLLSKTSLIKRQIWRKISVIDPVHLWQLTLQHISIERLLIYQLLSDHTIRLPPHSF